MSDKTCCYCSQPLNMLPTFKDNPLRLTHEYIVPTSRGGSEHPDNILFACIRCNAEKSDMTLEEYRVWVEKNPFHVVCRNTKLINIKRIIQEVTGNRKLYTHALTPPHRIGYSKEKAGKTVVEPGSYADCITGVKVLYKILLPIERKRNAKH